MLLPELLATLGQYRLLFVGALMLVVLRLAPVGLVGVVAHLFPRKGREAAPQQRTDISRFLAAGATGSGISVRNLAVSFGGVHAVRDLSFDARAGAITSIIGPNGAGKTTALNAICGFYRPDAGTVKLGEQTVSELRAHQIPRVGIARTYQTSRLFESLSVIDNVLIALRRGKLGAASFFASQHDEASAAAAAEGLLAFVGYRRAIDVPAGALAHVDKRLVEIARALAVRPAILALDKPAAGLDAADTALIDKVLRELASIGIAIILVEHDMELVMGVSSRVIVLDAGVPSPRGRRAKSRRRPRCARPTSGQAIRPSAGGSARFPPAMRRC